jgi:hypothetical protein
MSGVAAKRSSEEKVRGLMPLIETYYQSGSLCCTQCWHNRLREKEQNAEHDKGAVRRDDEGAWA